MSTGPTLPEEGAAIILTVKQLEPSPKISKTLQQNSLKLLTLDTQSTKAPNIHTEYIQGVADAC